MSKLLIVAGIALFCRVAVAIESKMVVYAFPNTASPDADLSSAKQS